MVAVLRTDASNAGYKEAVYKVTAGPAKHAELDREFVLNEKQYEHFTQCMSNPQVPTLKMLESHKKLQQFLQRTK